MKQAENELAQQWLNLASERLGAEVLFATDDFFAEKENMLKPGPAIFDVNRYTDRGKWMDGWESRRKRTPGHDYAIVKLGLAGRITGFNIDTSFFLGNHPPHAAVEACFAPDAKTFADLDGVAWQELLEKSALGPGQDNLFGIQAQGPFTHVKLHIYPDGGVARFRVYGRAYVHELPDGAFNLAGAEFGAMVVQCNDMFFSPKDNLIMPYPSSGMFDGWETRRRREPGNDWCVVELAAPGTIERVDVDTAYFKGNYPDRCKLSCASLPGGATSFEDVDWQPLLDEQKLEADHLHTFASELKPHEAITHVRLDIIPDGGVARLRCHGKVRKA